MYPIISRVKCTKGGREYHKPVGTCELICGIPVGIMTHRSRSLTGTGNYRSGSEVHNCQVLV